MRISLIDISVMCLLGTALGFGVGFIIGAGMTAKIANDTNETVKLCYKMHISDEESE